MDNKPLKTWCVAICLLAAKRRNQAKNVFSCVFARSIITEYIKNRIIKELYAVVSNNRVENSSRKEIHSGHFHIFYPFPRVQANAVNLTFPVQKRKISVPILPLENFINSTK